MTGPKHDPGSFVREVAESTRQTLQELRGQHDTLQDRVDDLQAENRRLEQVVEEQQVLIAGLVQEAKSSRQEQTTLEKQLSLVKSASRSLDDRYLQLEQQVGQLAGLYVASYRLNEALERPEVLASIQEIVINLVGSEQLAVFEIDPERPELVLATSFGVDAERWRRVRLGEGQVGSRAAAGEVWVAPEGEAGELTALVPLLAGGRLVGAIAIVRLLDHKPRLEACDRELLALLSTHAGHALYLSRLHGLACPPGEAVA